MDLWCWHDYHAFTISYAQDLDMEYKELCWPIHNCCINAIIGEIYIELAVVSSLSMYHVSKLDDFKRINIHAQTDYILQTKTYSSTRLLLLQACRMVDDNYDVFSFF